MTVRFQILNVDGHRLFDLPRTYFDEAIPGSSHSLTIVRNRDTLFRSITVNYSFAKEGQAHPREGTLFIRRDCYHLSKVP